MWSACSGAFHTFNVGLRQWRAPPPDTDLAEVLMLGNIVAVGHSASFNGDGLLDVLARNYYTGELAVYPHSGSFDGVNTYLPPVLISSSFGANYFRWVGAGDFTGNGLADVYVTTADAKCFLYPNRNGLNGLSTLGEPLHVGGKLPDITYDSLALADLTGNGRVDCVGRRVGTGIIDGILNKGINGDDTWARPQLLATVGTSDFPIGMADITCTGRLDLIIRRENGDLEACEFSGYAEHGEFPSGGGTRHIIGKGWDTIRLIDITDIDNDGHPDVLAVREDGTLVVYPHSGSFDADNPLATFRDPVVVGLGWRDFDFIS